jgi:hypothetical protein
VYYCPDVAVVPSYEDVVGRGSQLLSKGNLRSEVKQGWWDSFQVLEEMPNVVAVVVDAEIWQDESVASN